MAVIKTVGDAEVLVAEKVSATLAELGLLPQGYKCAARLHGKSRDKKRSASFGKNWYPDTDSISLTFERVHETERATSAAAANARPTSEPLPENGANDRVFDLIRALDRAESRPGYGFVALKWFRDTALPLEGFPWASEDAARRTVLSEAIDRRVILLNKVPNPKSPQFPVTTIRLNRLIPEVKDALGGQASAGMDFRPLPIRGESLSATVLRDRR